MKKKIYFVISSILQIIGVVYILINLNTIIQNQLTAAAETYAMFPVEYQERVMNSNMRGMMIFFSVIQIAINAIIIKIALSDGILKNKGKMIAFALICLFIGQSSIVQVLSIINFIVLLCLKRKNPEDYPEKKSIPEIEYQKPTQKEMILSIVLIIAYLSQFVLGNFLPDTIPQAGIIAVIITYYVLVTTLVIVCFKDTFKKDIRLLKENAKAYVQYVVPKLGIMYVIYILLNLACIILTQQATSVNQSMLESIPLWISIPLAVIWAPIVEESIFRGALRRFIKNDVLFVVISAIVFGLIHTISEASILNMIVLAIPYAVLGGFLAYIYAKTKNITTNILAHAFHNSIAMLVSALLLSAIQMI